jgi:hypothetical protein
MKKIGLPVNTQFQIPANVSVNVNEALDLTRQARLNRHVILESAMTIEGELTYLAYCCFDFCRRDSNSDDDFQAVKSCHDGAGFIGSHVCGHLLHGHGRADSPLPAVRPSTKSGAYGVTRPTFEIGSF